MDPTLDYKHAPEHFQVVDSIRRSISWVSPLEIFGQPNWKSSALTVTTENSHIDAEQWTSEIRFRFQPDFLVLDKLRYPQLVAKLNQLPTLRMEAPTEKIGAYKMLKLLPSWKN